MCDLPVAAGIAANSVAKNGSPGANMIASLEKIPIDHNITSSLADEQDAIAE